MNPQKFTQMVREFPFLANIFAGESISADSVADITVHRGDKNLLEVTPVYESHDIGSHGDYLKIRQFWFITGTGEVGQLSVSAWRTQVPHGTKRDTQVSPIGVQLMVDRGSVEALRTVTHIVEVFGENWDTWIDEWHVGIYKMERFDWVSFCRSFNLRFVC